MKMEAKKRKYSKSDEEIIAKHPSFQVMECSVNLVQISLPILATKKPLSGEDIERILDDDVPDNSSSEQVISPQSKSRLRKKENGMVFIPRSKYNEHPAKDILGTRKSKRNASKSIIKVKLSPRASKKTKNSPKVSKNNNSIYKKNSHSKSTPKRRNIVNSKSSVIEYHLEFPQPKSTNRRSRNSNSTKPLSDFMKIDSLPSKLWEIERIPPLLPNIVEEDSITKELMALTEENKENVNGQTDKTTCSESRGSDDDKNVKSSPSQDTDESNKLESDGTLLKDELEALLSDTNVKTDSEDPIKDDTISEQVPSESDITKEDIEKTIKDVVMDTGACEVPMDLMEDDAKGSDKEVPETNPCDIVDEEKKESEENSSKDELPTKDDDVKSDSAEKCDASESCPTETEPKKPQKEKSVRFASGSPSDKCSGDIIKSLIFRKYSENKKTYEKVVVFRASMDYTVTINNRPVELIGAPHEMTTIEDLQILLQIVDELNLNSFMVDYKS